MTWRIGERCGCSLECCAISRGREFRAKAMSFPVSEVCDEEYG